MGRTGDPEDPWASARARARELATEVLRPRTQRCPACGHEETTAARCCPRCGTSYVVIRPRRRLSRGARAAVATGAIAIAVTAAAVVPGLQDNSEREAAEAQRRTAALAAAERRRLLREARPRYGRVRGRVPSGSASATERVRFARRARAELERAVTRDARGRARRALLKGPVLATRCAPDPNTAGRRRAEDDPALRRAGYVCVAITSTIPAASRDRTRRRGIVGYPFAAVVDRRRGRYVWCRVSLRAGERGVSLAEVPTPRPCQPEPPAAGEP